MTPEKPHRHDTAADAVHDGRPVDAELARSGRKNPRIAVILAISTLAAVLIVFIPTIGDYVTPELIGGGKIPMIANLIQVQMLALDNRPLGSALAVSAMAIVALVSAVFLLINRRFLKVRS